MHNMADWATNTPWWVVAGFSVALIGMIVKASMWAGGVNTKLDSLNRAVSEIQGAIQNMLERLAPPSAVQASSPIQLTGFGQKISASVSARAWAIDHAPRLAKKTSGKPEFEVFEVCVSYVEKQFDKDAEFQREVRAGAYEHGTDADQVKKVYEVELRDRLLQLQAEQGS